MQFKPLLKSSLKPALITSGCVAGLLALTLTLAPRIAQADAPTPLSSGPVLASAPIVEALDQLNLTADQEAQLTALRHDTRSQLQAIVQPNQRQQFKTTWQQGQSFQESVAAMNLTPEQRQQIKAIFQSSRQQAKAVLTEPQRQQLKQLLQERLDEAL